MHDSEWYHEAQQYTEDAAERGDEHSPFCFECGECFDDNPAFCPACHYPLGAPAFVNPVDDGIPPF